MREQNIGVNVHYIPVYLHPYYNKYLGLKKGICPCSEKVYEQIISLPMWPGLCEKDIMRVIFELKVACKN